MGKLRQAKTESEIKALTVGKVRQEYNLLAQDYTKLIEQKYLLCPKCNEYRLARPSSNATTTEYYRDGRFATGLYPICKECLKLMAEQRSSHREKSKECKESVQRVLRMMDRPYIDSWYENCVKNVTDNNADAGVFEEHPSAFGSYMRGLNSLPQFREYTSWDDSDFGNSVSIDEEAVEDTKIVKSTLKDGRKRFGASYSDEEIMFLENEYKDWISRYECQTKAQEEVFEGLAMVKLQRHLAIKKGLSTKDLDKAYQDWLDTGNLKPKQNSMDAMSDAQTLGTLIQKYEEERPLPKIDPDLEDVDSIGRYIDTFFKGHICKVLGIKNNFATRYENEMKKYTVEPPTADEEEDSEVLFDKIFGGQTDG